MAHDKEFHPTCDQCRQWFETTAYFEQHKNARQWCVYCKDSYCDLEAHYEYYHILCSYCDLFYSNIDQYTTHADYAHPKCDQCAEMRFKTPAKLKKHKNARRSCSVCLYSSCNLKTHQKQCHVKCVRCSKWVNDNDEYTKHKDEFHPKCQHCSMRCRTKESLQRHLRGHRTRR
jgi:hypothetical protein